MQPLRLEEEDAALVVTQECLKHREDREEAELLVLGVTLSLSAYKIHEATYGLLLGGLQERHLSAGIEWSIDCSSQLCTKDFHQNVVERTLLAGACCTRKHVLVRKSTEPISRSRILV